MLIFAFYDLLGLVVNIKAYGLHILRIGSSAYTIIEFMHSSLCFHVQKFANIWVLLFRTSRHHDNSRFSNPLCMFMCVYWFPYIPVLKQWLNAYIRRLVFTY